MKYNIGEFISIKGYNNTRRKKPYGQEVLISVEDKKFGGGGDHTDNYEAENDNNIMSGTHQANLKKWR
jgi:hypothetical protein